MLITLALVGGLVATSWGLAQARYNASELAKANERLRSAIITAEKATDSAKQSATREQEARIAVDENWREATSTLARMLDSIVYSQDLKRPEMHNLRLQLIESGREYLQKSISKYGDSPEQRFQMAQSLHLAAFITFELQDLPAADKQMRYALSVIRRLCNDFPENNVYRKEAISALASAANMLAYVDRPADALETAQEGVALGEELARNDTSIESSIYLGRALTGLGVAQGCCYFTPELKHHSEHCRTTHKRALSILRPLARENDSARAEMLNSLKCLVYVCGFEDADAALVYGEELLTSLESFGTSPADPSLRGKVLLNLAEIWHRKGNDQRAVEKIDLCIDEWVRLTEADSSRTSEKLELARAFRYRAEWRSDSPEVRLQDLKDAHLCLDVVAQRQPLSKGYYSERIASSQLESRIHQLSENWAMALPPIETAISTLRLQAEQFPLDPGIIEKLQESERTRDELMQKSARQ